LTNEEPLTKMELKAIATYLRKVYPGVAEQDELWELIQRIDELVKGKNRDSKTTRRRTSSS
jgi:hypothetical protein